MGGGKQFSLTLRARHLCAVFHFWIPPSFKQWRMRIFRDNKSNFILLVASPMSGISRTFRAEFGPQCLHRGRNIFHFVKPWARGICKGVFKRMTVPCGNKAVVERKLGQSSEVKTQQLNLNAALASPGKVILIKYGQIKLEINFVFK